MNHDRLRPVEHLTLAERVARGQAARADVPRRAHGEWAPAADRRDPVAILVDQAADRVPDLLPIRYGRMAASPLACYRGAAAVMAADLAAGPRTSLEVQLCGDAHLSNFGGFASPERSLVFDVNDFDETLPGPFEWDVKRLAASFEVAGRLRSFKPKERRRIVVAGVRSYREAMAEFATMSNLDVWYSRVDANAAAARWGAEAGSPAIRQLQRTVTKAESKDRLRALDKLTEVRDGERCFISQPPLLVPIEEVFAGEDLLELQRAIVEAFRSYRNSLQPDRRRLLETYRLTKLARKVVGVGSVGTRCWVALLLGRTDDDPLFLQIKEANQSVLEPYLGRSPTSHHGERVVQGQRLMQATSDILLGWNRVTLPGGDHRDFYVRQLWDWKASAAVDTMPLTTLEIYARVCGWTLARAHARSGDRVALAAYLGNSDAFDRALLAFADAYADQTEHDHAALLRAIDEGRLPARGDL